MTDSYYIKHKTRSLHPVASNSFNMKIFVVVVFVLSNVATSAIGQVAAKDILDKNIPITWLGLDFSNAKFVGDREKYGSISDVKNLINSWNELMEREHDKYNVGVNFHKVKVENKFNITDNHNEALDVTEMLSSSAKNYTKLTEEDVAAIIKSYDFEDLNGMGLMFIVEAFNKFDEQGSMWVTFIDLQNKEVILTERMVGPGGGKGLRNFWGRSIFEVMENVRRTQYELWRTKLGK